MEERSVAAMEELGAAIERLHFARSKRSIKDEQKLFVLDGIDDHEHPRRNKIDSSDIKHKFLFGFMLRAHVLEEYVWYVTRNGKFYKELENGPHWLVNWDILFAKWQVRRINLRTVLLPAFAVGRVKGPQLPHHAGQMFNVDLALDVVADFRLLCRITSIQQFLRHESPIKTFYAYFNDMVREHISELPYDQYGKWASTLRTQIERSLQHTGPGNPEGPDDTEKFIGLKIERVFVDSIASNKEHDAQTLELYRLVEKGKYELEAALSMQRQGEILDISPAILALQNNEAGRTLLECDAELRKLMIAAGLRPGGMVQLRSDPYQIEQTPGSYLQSTRRPYFPPVTGISGPLPLMPPTNTGAFGPVPSPPFHTTPTTPLTPPPTYDPRSQPPMSNATDPLELRRALEREKLSTANFSCSNWAQQIAQFDEQGQPIPGNMLWILTVFVLRSNGHLAIIFQCTRDYPQNPPTVRVRSPNSTETRDLFPNTIVNWTPDYFLIDTVREIADSLPG